MQATLILGGVLLGLGVLLVVLLKRTAERAGAAGRDAEFNAGQREARERRDEVLEEPVADERAWLDAQRERLRDESD